MNESGRDWIKQGEEKQEGKRIFVMHTHVGCKRWRGRVGDDACDERHLGQINCYFFWFGSRQSRVVAGATGFQQILVATRLFFIRVLLSVWLWIIFERRGSRFCLNWLSFVDVFIESVCRRVSIGGRSF